VRPEEAVDLEFSTLGWHEVPAERIERQPGTSIEGWFVDPLRARLSTTRSLASGVCCAS